jgi:hypothetical protein
MRGQAHDALPHIGDGTLDRLMRCDAIEGMAAEVIEWLIRVIEKRAMGGRRGDAGGTRARGGVGRGGLPRLRLLPRSSQAGRGWWGGGRRGWGVGSSSIALVRLESWT